MSSSGAMIKITPKMRESEASCLASHSFIGTSTIDGGTSNAAKS